MASKYRETANPSSDPKNYLSQVTLIYPNYQEEEEVDGVKKYIKVKELIMDKVLSNGQQLTAFIQDFNNPNPLQKKCRMVNEF
mmetsp:Transcript_34655/g.53031  ORF Transcript_34655/g.53031 Transcript_34655/m.53031 type:complete len:83 (+) Transcript_34655:2430-2678(+)